MARTALTPVTVGAAGVVLPDDGDPAELTDGNSFGWGQGRRLYVHNGDTTALTVTLQTPGTVGTFGSPYPDAAITVAAGTGWLSPPLGLEFRRPSDGAVWVDYSGADMGVTVAVLDL